MKLSKDQVIEILKNPRLSNEIQKGRDYESSLRVYTESKTKDELLHEKGFKSITGFLDTIFTKKRSDRIKEFISYPLSSVDITESILTDLYKVFDSRNSFFDFELPKANGGQKLRETIARINPVKWIEEKGKEVLKNKPNTIIVVDKDDKGNPYLIALESDRVLDCEINTDSTLNYVAFIHSIKKKEDKEVKRIAFYDTENYWVFIENDGEFEVEKQVPHKAGVCPARMFINEKVSSRNDFARKIPFTSSISKLREWQLFDFYKFYVDHYNPFPVIEKVEQKCDVEGCEAGVITESKKFIEDGEEVYRDVKTFCASCQNKEVMGPGVLIEIPAKDTKDEPDSAGVFRMISPDTSNLEYLQSKLDGIEKNVRLKTVGIENNPNNNAVNELQMLGSFESRKNVLIKIKSNLDDVYRWIVTTIAKLQSGANVGVVVHVNFGTEFYLETEAELIDKYKKAKESGLPIEEVDFVYDNLLATKYKGNPNKLERLEIIKLLDPLPHESLSSAIELHGKGLVNLEELILKSRLLVFINRFEIEQAPLIEFGKREEMKVKLESIKNILKQYVNEYKNETQQTGSIKETV